MKSVLLIIDDREEIGRVIKRSLRKNFDDILFAKCAAEAVLLLDANLITHVVCDLFLGKDEPLGHELMREWRNRKPSIKYVALFTGSNTETMPVHDGIDAVFQKPDGLMDLIGILKSHETKEVSVLGQQI